MKKKFLLFGVLIPIIFFSILVYAAQYYQVNSGATVEINEHGVCQQVKNNNAQAMFVPTNTAGEWTAFRNNAPGVILSACSTNDFCISAGDDDVYVEYDVYDDIWSLVQTGSTLWIGDETYKDFIEIGTGLRFNNIQIPKNAIITSAKLKFKGLSSSTNTVNSKIRAEASDNPSTFSTVTNYFNRPRTSQYITWDGIPEFLTGVIYQTPDFKNVIQEIVNRNGWSSGNSVVIFWDDHDGRSTINNAHRKIYSYESGNPPCLLIEWT